MVYDVEEAIVGRRVTVFGANGRVGSLIVAELLTRGYDVVAVVHRGSRLPKNPHLRVIRADIYNSKSVDDAVVGSSAVVSALGSWGTHKKDILTVGMTHIIAGMQHHGIQRIVSLTGVEARALGDYLSFMHRLAHRMIRAVAGKILSDGEQHIVLLESSGLTWTVVRSPIMSSQAAHPGRYKLTMKRPLSWARISRSLVVSALVDILEQEAWCSKAPFIVAVE